jgi:hypothetical protein
VVSDGVQVGRYLANARGLFVLKSVGHGVPNIKLPLANFSARIVTEIRRDDGVDSTREFQIEARLGGQTRRLMVAAGQFASMKWVTEQLGARAVIAAGMGIKDQVREAIQLLSSPQMVVVFSHTGWSQLGQKRWAYMHDGGAVGATGAVAGVETSLPAELAPFILPVPPIGPDLRSAVRASLALLDLAPDRVTVPVLGAVWRSILGAVDFSVFVYGATGRFKTALATLLQQHFGADFTAHRLPGSWASTANFNERLAFIAKDALLVIDDFRPGTSTGERQRLHQDADRLLRAAANGAGRGRLKSDTSLRPAHPPRALILSTAEEKPRGQSLLARMLLVEVAPGDIDPERLSACQRDADAGLYAQATAAFIKWLAPKLDQVRAEMTATHGLYRQRAAHQGLHRRTPGIVADLFVGWERFLGFAHEAELTEEAAEVYRVRVWRALIEVARRQSEHQLEANPADRFLLLLRSAIATGRAHVAARDGGMPENPGAWGWRADERAGKRRRLQWLSQGVRVGSLDRDDLYLDIDSTYRAAQAMATDGGGIAVGIQTLAKKLNQTGRLKSVDQRRGKLRVRRIISGARREVLHLPADLLQHSLAEKNQPDRPIGQRKQ